MVPFCSAPLWEVTACLHNSPEDYNCMAVVSSQTYNSDSVMFEYTQSRHRPDYFRFYDNAVRKLL